MDANYGSLKSLLERNIYPVHHCHMHSSIGRWGQTHLFRSVATVRILQLLKEDDFLLRKQ